MSLAFTDKAFCDAATSFHAGSADSGGGDELTATLTTMLQDNAAHVSGVTLLHPTTPVSTAASSAHSGNDAIAAPASQALLPSLPPTASTASTHDWTTIQAPLSSSPRQPFRHSSASPPPSLRDRVQRLHSVVAAGDDDGGSSVYVSPSGHDVTTCGPPWAPCLTLGAPACIRMNTLLLWSPVCLST